MAFLVPLIIPILISVGVEAGLAWLSKAINPTPTSGRLGQDDFHALESAYSLPLPKCWGTERVPGNITWISPVREHKYNVGGGLFSDGVDVFYYTQDVEYSFTLGPAKAFVKIFLADKVIYDQSAAPTDATSNTYGNSLHQTIGNLLSGPAKDRLMESYELFLGTETQQPSAIVSAVEGFGTVPADRGIVKVEIKNLNLTKLGGNSLPAASAIIQFADYEPSPVDKSIDVLPTVSASGNEGTTWGGVGDSSASLTSGEITVQHLSTFNSYWRSDWSGFTAPTIPDGATITGIFPTCEAIEWDPTGNFNSKFGIAGDNHTIGVIVSSHPFDGPPPAISEPSTYETYQSDSIGTTVDDITNAMIAAGFSSTIPTTGDATLRVRNPRLEVHYTVPLVPPTGTTLAQIVADLCVEAGLTEDQFDVTELASTLVKGFKTEQKAIRDVVRELMEVYPFDGYESDGMLKFVLRSGDPVVTIEEDDLVLSGDADTGNRISEPITQENEIPMKVDVHYADIDRDFQDNVQHSKRIIEPSPTMESITVKSLSTNVVMNADEAAQAAERNLWEPWATKRGGNYQLMPKHLRLDAADKVQVNYKNQTLIHRITQANLGSGLGIQIAARSHDSDVYTSSATGSSSGGTFPVPLPSAADPGLVNVPVIFEPPAGLVPPGAAGVLWIAVSGASENYGGCEAFISIDGINYESLGDMLPGVTGFLLSDYPSASDPDSTDTLSVDLTECSGVLPSRTRSTADGFFDLTYVGVNASPAVRDFELVCPTTATERATVNTYDLTTYIRRGAQGSTIVDHPTGSRFADLTGKLVVNLSSAWVGITLYFKFAAFNKSRQQENALADCVVYPYTPLGLSISAIVGESPSGTINSSNTSFGLAIIPNPAASLMVFRNGLVLRQGVDYTLSGSAISMVSAPQAASGSTAADWLYAIYRTDGSSALFDNGVTPSGTIDGVNADFTLPHAPDPTDSLLLFLNGLLQLGSEYSLASDTITEAEPPVSSDWLLAWARIDGTTASYSYAETPSGSINGSNTAFTLAQTPRPVTAVMLFYNGLFLRPNTDYTIAGGSLTMAVAPESGASLVAYYPY
jgi:hypothetical protein